MSNLSAEHDVNSCKKQLYFDSGELSDPLGQYRPVQSDNL